MLGGKLNTLLAVVEQQNFTKAAKALALTQPAVSHHIRELEEELGVQLIVRRGGRIILTPEGEIAVKYARRMKALYDKLRTELMNTERGRKQLRVGITHTAESNLTAEALAKCSEENPGLSITILTDTIKNLYDMLSSYEIDMAIVEGNPAEEGLRSVMLDTDHLLCVMSVNNPLSRRAMVTLEQLKRERMILRLPTSATRVLFEATLRSINDAIENFNVTLEVDNIEIINKPAGYEADLVTQSCTVLVRGPQEALDAVTASQIRIVADLSDLDPSTGTRTVPVRVYLDGSSEVGVVGTYNVSISITRS